METAAKRQCTPFVPELNSSFDPMSAQKTHYMAELLSSQTSSQLSAQACAQEAIVKAVQSAEQKSVEPCQETFLSRHGLIAVTSSASESPFPLVESKDRQNPSKSRPPAAICPNVRAPTDPSVCDLPSIPSQDKTYTFQVKRADVAKTATKSSQPATTPAKTVTPQPATTPAKTVTPQPATTPAKTVTPQPATTPAKTVTPQPAIMTKAPLGITPTHVIPEAVAHPAYNFSPGRIGTSPTKKREHSAISQSMTTNIILMDSSDSETESDCDLQDDTPTTSSLEAASSSLENTPITISIPKNLLQDDTPTTSSLEAASSSLENTPITISIPKNLFQSDTPTTSREVSTISATSVEVPISKNLLQCEYTPTRFLTHSKSNNEELLVGMTPLQLLKIRNMRNFIRDLIGASFDYTFNEESYKRLSIRRYQFGKDDRIPFLVKSTICNCKVCQNNVSTNGCYSDVRISFLLPFLAVEKWSAKEVENNWIFGDKTQDTPGAFSNTYFQPHYTYTIQNLNVVAFDICLFAKSSSLLGAGVFETSDDLFTAISNYLMMLFKPYIQTMIDASPSFGEWAANNPHIIIQKDEQEPLIS
jgi:hypothetical protein